VRKTAMQRGGNQTRGIAQMPADRLERMSRASLEFVQASNTRVSARRSVRWCGT
jgi:hypothetical protein